MLNNSPFTSNRSRLFSLLVFFFANLALLIYSLQLFDESSPYVVNQEAQSEQIINTDSEEKSDIQAIEFEVIEPPKPLPETPTVIASKAEELKEPVKQETAKKGEPRIAGIIPSYMTARDFEHLVRSLNGRLIIYDNENNKLVRIINKGIPIAPFPNAMMGLSNSSHVVTDDLESKAVDAWINEAKSLSNSSSFDIHAKLGATAQSGFFHAIKGVIANKGYAYQDVDQVNFTYERTGLVINDFTVNDKTIVVNALFSG